MKKKKWIASINRYKTVVEKYEKTIYVEEALHRLVELYYTIGLENESQKYASLLGYNYQSSRWYEKSYKVFNNDYKSKLELNNEKKSMLKKFKKLFD
jgi:DNA uptake lipoprotein